MQILNYTLGNRRIKIIYKTVIQSDKMGSFKTANNLVNSTSIFYLKKISHKKFCIKQTTKNKQNHL